MASKALLSPSWLTEYLYHKWPRICSTCRKHSWSFPHSWLITGFVTGATPQVPLVYQELLTLPEHLCSPLVFSGVHVAQSLVFCVVFCRSLFVFSGVRVAQSLVFCVVFCRLLFVLLSFHHCFVCPSSIYRFSSPLWYLQRKCVLYKNIV